MKPFFQNSKVNQSTIEILVGIREGAQSLLPTLGRSANLNEPWAPRSDTSRSLVLVFTAIVNYLAISNFDSLYFVKLSTQLYRVRVVGFTVVTTTPVRLQR